MKDDISDKNQIQSMDVKTWVLILMLLFKETFPKQTWFQIFLKIDCKLYIHSMFHLMLNVDKLDYFFCFVKQNASASYFRAQITIIKMAYES